MTTTMTTTMTIDFRCGIRGLRLALAGCAVVLLLAPASGVLAQVLTAEDDFFYVPQAEALIIDAFGVLDNDLLDDESAGESGATAEIVTGVSHGTLALGSDGSFTYSPAAGFDGTDQFVYRAVFGGVSDIATVTLSACTAGPQVFTCWKQGAFLAKAAELGHPSFVEGFENDAVWGSARNPNTLPTVSSRGFEWRANDFDPTHTDPPQPPPPPPNHITTGSGAARTGQWGIFDRGHGYATGTALECDVDNPDPHCLYHDGVTVRRESSSGPLFGAGGWIDGTYGANVAIVLDGDWQNPIGGGKIGLGGLQFFGVIDAGPTGFTEIQFRETDGKAGQAHFIFADDFRLLAERNVAIPALGTGGLFTLGLAIAVAGGIGAAQRVRSRRETSRTRVSFK
jgi:hypothetical protein